MEQENQNRKIFIGGNFKSNGSLGFIKSHSQFLNEVKFDTNKCTVVLCPTYIHLEHLKQSLDSRFLVSAQNVSRFGEGAYTGEITAKQLIDIGINWTLIGHSERREYFGDTEEAISDKIKHCQGNEVNIIICIGEKLAEREANKTFEVIDQQMQTIIKNVTNWDKVVIAYEPVWAIGTGKTASPQQAQEVHSQIRNYLATHVSEYVGRKITIIYGGSVTDQNCNELIKENDIDGFLVGGASLKTTFKTIVESYQFK